MIGTPENTVVKSTSVLCLKLFYLDSMIIYDCEIYIYILDRTHLQEISMELSWLNKDLKNNYSQMFHKQSQKRHVIFDKMAHTHTQALSTLLFLTTNNGELFFWHFSVSFFILSFCEQQSWALE